MPALTRKLCNLISRLKKRKKEKERERERERGERSRSPTRRCWVSSGSAIWPGRKSNMEEEHICIDNLSFCWQMKILLPAAFYGIFNGHGGGEAAAYAQRKFLKYIVKDPVFRHQPELAIANAFTIVDNAIHLPGGIHGGVTALVALLWGKILYIANAGDSRAVIVNKKKIVVMSRDHKHTDSVKRCRIERHGRSGDSAGLLNSRPCVTRSLGERGIMRSFEKSHLISEPEIEIRQVEEEDEFMIMASAGVWEVVSYMDAANIVGKSLASHRDLNRAAEALVKKAMENKSQDNLTVLVVVFQALLSTPSPRMRYCFCVS